MNLETALERSGGRGPGFHFIRHALSLTILLHHASVLTTGGDIAPLATKGDAVATMSQALAGGDAAFMRQTVVELLRPFLFALVGAFFVLSGFLVAGSAFRTKNVGRFLAFRILRIMPALSLVVLFSSFVLGPIVTTLTLGEYFQDFNFLRYFGNLCGLYWPQLPEVFTANPIPHATNWNLWTLTPEFSAYAVVTVLMLTGVIYREQEFTRLFLVISAALILIVALGAFGVATRRDTTNFSAWLIMYSFIAGVVMWACAKHIPLSRSLFLLCGVSYYVLMIAKWNDVLAVLTLAYCVVYVGMQPFAWFDRIVKGDLSSGIYLYGFPITQTLIFYLNPHMADMSNGLKKAIVLSGALALTALVASASWVWVEKPALGLKRFIGGAKSKATAAADFLPPAE